MKKEVVYVAAMKGNLSKVGRTKRPLIREFEIRSSLGLYNDTRMFIMFPCDGISSRVEWLAHKILRQATQSAGLSEVFPCEPCFAARCVAEALRIAAEEMGYTVGPAALNRHLGVRSKPKPWINALEGKL